MAGLNPAITAPLMGSGLNFITPISKPRKPQKKRCVIQVDDGRLAGSFFIPEQSWRITCKISGTQNEDPRITLAFAAKKRKEWMGESIGKDGLDEHTETYKLQFRPGLVSRYWPEHWMMEDYQRFDMAASDDRSICPAMLPRYPELSTPICILVFQFTLYDIPSNSKPNPEVWDLYKSSGIMEVLQQIWDIKVNQKPSVIKIWVRCMFSQIQIDVEAFEKAVNQQYSPWVNSFARGAPWRYLKDPKAPMIDRLIDGDVDWETKRKEHLLAVATRSQAEKDAIKSRKEAKNDYYRRKNKLAREESRKIKKKEFRRKAGEAKPEDQLEGVVERPNP